MVRLLVRLGAGVAGLATVSATASAHDGIGHGGDPATFAIVLGLPVVAGLLGGGAAVRYRRTGRRGERRRRRTSVALGLLLVVLGGTFALIAITRSIPLTLAGGTVGAVSAVWFAERGTTAGVDRPDHAHLTLGAVCTHRVLEGVVLGALYGTGATVGLVGALVLAGHTALETAAVGGLYASRRGRASAAVVLVQLGYVAGAAGGIGVVVALPPSVEITALALAGGILLVVGATEAGRSFATDRHRTRRIERTSRTEIETERT